MGREWQIRDIVAEVDVGEQGGDGLLDFKEFVHMMTRPLGCIDRQKV